MTFRTGLVGAGVCLAVGAAIGIVGYRWVLTPRVTVVTAPGPVQIKYVDRPTIVARDVVRYVTDPREADRLMADLAYAQQRITVLTEALATATSGGSGTITYVDRPVPGATVREAHFADWRLTFDAVDDRASYQLRQRYEALTAVGRDRDGRPTATTRLFEIGPGEARARVPLDSLAVVAATPDAPRWHLRAAVTAGAGYAGTLAGWRPGAVVGLRWASYGTSTAAEDEWWSVAAPAVWLDGAGAELGVLPVSLNLGHVWTRQPFRDVWISPFIGVRPVPLGIGKVGVVLHATF